MSIQKRALVVDDSKSARLVLRRMLEKHGLAVHALESATKALDFLAHNHPDVVFMDHMMPGTDGFEAVKAIKDNPDTATIPVMMYTSKGGDLYLSQARALGAVGVLPKTVAPAELFKSLKLLGLIEERRSEEPTENEEQASERAEDIRTRSTAPAPMVKPGLHRPTQTGEQLDVQMRKLLNQQRIELREDLLRVTEIVSVQTGNHLNKELAERFEALRQQVRPTHTSVVIPVLVLGVLLIASMVWNLILHNREPEPQSVPTATAQVPTAQQPGQIRTPTD